MTLKDKIQIVLDKYNGGVSNTYSNLMMCMIESYSESKLIKISGNLITDGIKELSIQELIGFCITESNPDLFNSESKDTYLEITEHCPH